MPVSSTRGPLRWSDVPDAPDSAAFWPESPHLRDRLLPEEAWVEGAGTSLHVDRLPGQPSRGDEATTVILLHGGGGHGRVLLPFALPLHAAGHETLALDLLNFGLARREKPPPTFHRWIELVSALVDRSHAEGRRVVLYGLSIGGMAAYHVAAENPRVAGVVATMLADFRDPRVRDAAAASRLMARVVYPLVSALPRLFDRIAGSKRLVVLDGAAHLPFEQPAFDRMQAAVLAFLAGSTGVRGGAGAREDAVGIASADHRQRLGQVHVGVRGLPARRGGQGVARHIAARGTGLGDEERLAPEIPVHGGSHGAIQRVQGILTGCWWRQDVHVAAAGVRVARSAVPACRREDRKG